MKYFLIAVGATLLIIAALFVFIVSRRKGGNPKQKSVNTANTEGGNGLRLSQGDSEQFWWEENHIKSLLASVGSLLLLILGVWMFAPEGIIEFIKKYYSIAFLIFTIVTSFILAKKQVDAVNVWTLPLVIYVFTLAGSTLMLVVSLYMLA